MRPKFVATRAVLQWARRPGGSGWKLPGRRPWDLRKGSSGSKWCDDLDESDRKGRAEQEWTAWKSDGDQGRSDEGRRTPEGWSTVCFVDTGLVFFHMFSCRSRRDVRNGGGRGIDVQNFSIVEGNTVLIWSVVCGMSFSPS